MKIIIQLLLIAAFISTIIICVSKPTMHKSVLVYDSGYKLIPETTVMVEETEMPVMEYSPETEVVQMTANQKIDNQISALQQQMNQFIDSDERAVTTPITVTTAVQTKNKTTSMPKTASAPVQTAVQQRVITPTTATSQTYTKYGVTPPKTVTTTQTPVQDKAVQQPVTHTASAPIGSSTKYVPPASNTTQAHKTTATVTKPVTHAPQPNKVMTAQEEEIAWNVWRSNLQNQIMRDSKSRLPNVPNGTIFRFSFNVDKYGKITNVNTSSTNPAYTPYAIQYIGPVIRSYQGRSILNFPAGTNRVTTTVTGSWKISTNAKYSTSHDYNDIEKVKK